MRHDSRQVIKTKYSIYGNDKCENNKMSFFLLIWDGQTVEMHFMYSFTRSPDDISVPRGAVSDFYEAFRRGELASRMKLELPSSLTWE